MVLRLNIARMDIASAQVAQLVSSNPMLSSNNELNTLDVRESQNDHEGRPASTRISEGVKETVRELNRRINRVGEKLVTTRMTIEDELQNAKRM